MKNLPESNTPCWPKFLLLASIASVLSACGGGAEPGSTGSATGNSDTLLVDLANKAMTGTVVIEERNGKTVFDGWFTHASSAESGAGSASTTITEDRCEITSVHADAADQLPVKLGAAEAVEEFASVGQSVKVNSRLGEFETLVKQVIGDTTVYAPEERWKSEALPEDAALSFESGVAFGRMSSIMVPPIMPLIWLAPETGVMANAASSLRWEPSFNEQVKIKLRLSAIDFSDSENPAVVTVSCDLVDDGLYTLPAEFQQKLPDDDMGISVYAIREHVQQVRDGDTNLNVVQLSYPAPVKP